MATMAGRKISVNDYPEHLNPFHEDDNHNKIRFWTIGRRMSRSNSITFSGIKDLKNSWAFRSFLKKGKKSEQSSQDKKQNSRVNGESSPIVYRRALQYSSASSTTPTRNTVGSPERYVYGGSVTPLPRSRFQERLRSTSNHEVNSLSLTPRMARSEVSGSRLSVESTNPFDEGPVPPVRASRRKKKRAPLPPSTAADVSVSSETSELHITEDDDIKEGKPVDNSQIKDENLNVELKIIENEDNKSLGNTSTDTKVVTESNTLELSTDTPKETSDVMSISSKDEKLKDKEIEDNDVINNNNDDDEVLHITEDTIRSADSEDDILNKVSFSKIDIVKYRRNSSVNEDDIRLRRGNLEDFHSLSNKRSKSMTNAFDTNYMTYDINLNENNLNKDANDNEEPQKVICKLYDEPVRKQSIDTISSTEKEFIEIDKATREFEMEINKLTSALNDEEDFLSGGRLSVSDIKKRFDKTDASSPNPIPKPRRSHYGGSTPSPVNGNYQ